MAVKSSVATRTKSRTSAGPQRSPEAEVAIRAAAREVLAEKGYAGFTIDEVARRAGAGKPTVYRWWKTKADLFIDIYGAEKDAALAMPNTGTLSGDLALYARGLWTFWQQAATGASFRALIAEAQTSEAALAVLRDKFLPERTRPLREILARAERRGEISGEETEALLAMFLGYCWFHLLTDRLQDGESKLAALEYLFARLVPAAPRSGKAKAH